LNSEQKHDGPVCLGFLRLVLPRLEYSVDTSIRSRIQHLRAVHWPHLVSPSPRAASWQSDRFDLFTRRSPELLVRNRPHQFCTEASDPPAPSRPHRDRSGPDAEAHRHYPQSAPLSAHRSLHLFASPSRRLRDCPAAAGSRRSIPSGVSMRSLIGSAPRLSIWRCSRESGNEGAARG
jgi:hypothetical protein